MKVELLAYSQLTPKKKEELAEIIKQDTTDGKLIAFTAIRNCYSHVLPSEIIKKEGFRYLKPATDGKTGTEMDRLIRHIVNSGHSSTLEHLSFTFIIEGVSRALMAQLTRHRVGFSYSIESQRYVNYKSDGKSGGITFTAPIVLNDEQMETFLECMKKSQEMYDELISLGVKAEDARSVLPQATNTNIIMTCNITSFLHFYKLRKPGTHAQGEIQELAAKMKNEILVVESWLGGLLNE